MELTVDCLLILLSSFSIIPENESSTIIAVRH